VKQLTITLAPLLLGACAAAPQTEVARSFSQLNPTASPPPVAALAPVAPIAVAAPVKSLAPLEPAAEIAAVENVALEEPLAAAATVKTVTIDEIDSGMVCESRQRPASRITEKFCYTREEYAATQDLRDEIVRQQMDDLRREQAMFEAMQRQIEEQRRRAAEAAFRGMR